MRAARAAEDPVLVLDADNVHAVRFERRSEAAVFGPVAHGQTVEDDWWVRELLARALKGDDAESAVRRPVGSQPFHEVSSEGGDPAQAGHVRRQEGDRWKARFGSPVIAGRRLQVAPSPIVRSDGAPSNLTMATRAGATTVQMLPPALIRDPQPLRALVTLPQIGFRNHNLGPPSDFGSGHAERPPAQ